MVLDYKQIDFSVANFLFSPDFQKTGNISVKFFDVNATTLGRIFNDVFYSPSDLQQLLNGKKNLQGLKSIWQALPDVWYECLSVKYSAMSENNLIALADKLETTINSLITCYVAQLNVSYEYTPDSIFGILFRSIVYIDVRNTQSPSTKKIINIIDGLITKLKTMNKNEYDPKYGFAYAVYFLTRTYVMSQYFAMHVRKVITNDKIFSLQSTNFNNLRHQLSIKNFYFSTHQTSYFMLASIIVACMQNVMQKVKYSNFQIRDSEKTFNDCYAKISFMIKQIDESNILSFKDAVHDLLALFFISEKNYDLYYKNKLGTAINQLDLAKDKELYDYMILFYRLIPIINTMISDNRALWQIFRDVIVYFRRQDSWYFGRRAILFLPYGQTSNVISKLFVFSCMFSIFFTIQQFCPHHPEFCKWHGRTTRYAKTQRVLSPYAISKEQTKELDAFMTKVSRNADTLNESITMKEFTDDIIQKSPKNLVPFLIDSPVKLITLRIYQRFHKFDVTNPDTWNKIDNVNYRILGHWEVPKIVKVANQRAYYFPNFLYHLSEKDPQIENYTFMIGLYYYFCYIFGQEYKHFDTIVQQIQNIWGRGPNEASYESRSSLDEDLDFLIKLRNSPNEEFKLMYCQKFQKSFKFIQVLQSTVSKDIVMRNWKHNDEWREHSDNLKKDSETRIIKT